MHKNSEIKTLFDAARVYGKKDNRIIKGGKKEGAIKRL
jgi:hypothetical protein